MQPVSAAEPVRQPQPPSPAPSTPPRPAPPQDAVTLSQPASQAQPQMNPIEMLRGIARYIRDIRTDGAEPPELQGVVFEQYPDGRMVILKRGGETRPDVPPGGQPDIPADAVRNNRVVIYTDGIHQTIGTQQDQIRRLLQAPASRPGHGASVDQPVIGIHEAKGETTADDVQRIVMDLAFLKILQARWVPEKWVHKKIYRCDPVVRSVHDEVRQSLQLGRDVQLVAHSGGGAETALALTMLSQEDGGRWKNLIAQHVRVLALAPAVSKKDYELAGVKADNILYTGSVQDPLWHWASHYVTPAVSLSNLHSLKSGVEALIRLARREGLPHHSPDYIFWRNAGPPHRIQQFLDGGRGGQVALP